MQIQRFFPIVFSLCTFVPLSPSSAGPGQGEGAIAWEADFEAALQKAAKEEKPILVAFNMDGESANDETAKFHYVDPDVVALSRKMVCLVGSSGTHAAEGAVCPRFGTITCEQHQKVEIKARGKYIQASVVRSPQHILCNSKGLEIARKVYLISKQELAKAMAVAIAQTAKGANGIDLATAEKARVDKLLQEAESKNAEVRKEAFQQLAVADDPRAIPALLAKAKAGNQELDRYMAISALGKKGNYAALKPLLGFLKETNAKIVIYAIASLGELQLPDPAPDLTAVLKKEKQDRIRGHAVHALAKCHPESPEVLKTCIDVLKSASAQIEPQALLALYTLKPDPKIGAAVKPLLESKNVNTRALAAWVLGSQRDPSLIPALEKIQKEDKAPPVREMAEKAIAFAKGEKVSDYDNLYTEFYQVKDLVEGGGGDD